MRWTISKTGEGWGYTYDTPTLKSALHALAYDCGYNTFRALCLAPDHDPSHFTITQEAGLLILDVDETLIWGTDPTEYPLEPNPRIDFYSCNKFPIMKRPFVDEFLRWAFSFPFIRVAFWSVADNAHVNSVLSHLLLDHERPEFVFTQDRCTTHLKHPDEWDDNPLERFTKIKYLKKVLKRGFDPNRILALDDDPQRWRHSYGNLVRIRPFMGDLQDRELLRVIPFLEKWFQDPRGVRKIEKRGW